jgi:hypothetical protein
MPIQATETTVAKYNIWFESQLQHGEKVRCFPFSNSSDKKEHIISYHKGDEDESVNFFIKGEVGTDQHQNTAGHTCCIDHFTESFESDDMVIRAIDHLETNTGDEEELDYSNSYIQRLVDLVFAKLRNDPMFRADFFSEELTLKDSHRYSGKDEEMR